MSRLMLCDQKQANKQKLIEHTTWRNKKKEETLPSHEFCQKCIEGLPGIFESLVSFLHGEKNQAHLYLN